MQIEHALEIVKKLVKHGYIAYFAGGWVRDFVMKHPSDDIDIATNAPTEVLLDLFPHTILVGLQFGVVIVVVEGHQFEVATFRKDISYLNGRKPEMIEPSDPKEDALRRDFTINGMFYDPLENKIHDFVGGIEDIERKIIRAIGNPYERFFEDRLRMMRAFRFAARFDFTMEPETQEAIRENVSLLFPAVAMERIWQEFTKMSAYPRFERALIDMQRLELLPVIFPELSKTHLKDLQERVEPLKSYPKDAPASLFLQELFPKSSADELIAIGKYLKMSNKEIEFLAYYAAHRPFNFSTLFDSAQFYAHPFAKMCLDVYSSRLLPREQEAFMETHRHKQNTLRWHIERIRNRTPIVSSKDLQLQGIAPGRKMGILIREAEKLAINNSLQETAAVLEQLKKMPIWRSNA